MGRGRTGSASNRPSRVFVPPMSPASSIGSLKVETCHLTSPSLCFIFGPFAPQRLSRRGRLPSLSPDRPGCPLEGQLVVFTGKLSSLGRKDARALVTRLGGATADDVNAKTTMLVIGAEGFGPTPDREKSNKLKRAEELNALAGGGAAIRILTEEDFCRLAGVATPDTLKRQYHAMRDVLARYPALREEHLPYL